MDAAAAAAHERVEIIGLCVSACARVSACCTRSKIDRLLRWFKLFSCALILRCSIRMCMRALFGVHMLVTFLWHVDRRRRRRRRIFLKRSSFVYSVYLYQDLAHRWACMCVTHTTHYILDTRHSRSSSCTIVIHI